MNRNLQLQPVPDCSVCGEGPAIYEGTCAHCVLEAMLDASAFTARWHELASPLHKGIDNDHPKR